MFTGIVEEVGTVVTAGARLEVRASKVRGDAEPGASIAVNGVCLTLVDRAGNGAGSMDVLAFDVSDETLRRTALGDLSPGDAVNLERPATLVQRLGGHLVQGHVDCVGRTAEVRSVDVGVEMTFELPADVFRYLVEKGSVAVDGVSLTVAAVAAPRVTVALIPFTLDATNLGRKRPGDPVNVEVDVIAKYVEGLVRARTGPGTNEVRAP
jgi:riboflavin synthase